MATEPTAVETAADENVAAFLRDLPELLRTRPEEWVAYAHGRLVRSGPKATPLHQYCRRELGLPFGAFIVRLVVPEGSPDIEVRPW